MRDPNRIHTTIRQLARTWQLRPDLRLGQLLCIASGALSTYAIEDERLLQLLVKLEREWLNESRD